MSSCRAHYKRCLVSIFASSCDFNILIISLAGSSAVTLQGSEWITYIIYDSNGKAHSPVNKVALEFKVSG